MFNIRSLFRKKSSKLFVDKHTFIVNYIQLPYKMRNMEWQSQIDINKLLRTMSLRFEIFVDWTICLTTKNSPVLYEIFNKAFILVRDYRPTNCPTCGNPNNKRDYLFGVISLQTNLGYMSFGNCYIKNIIKDDINDELKIFFCYDRPIQSLPYTKYEIDHSLINKLNPTDLVKNCSG